MKCGTKLLPRDYLSSKWTTQKTSSKLLDENWIIKKFYSLQRVMGSFGSTQLPNLFCVEHERELYFWTLQVIVLQGAVCGIHVIWAF